MKRRTLFKNDLGQTRTAMAKRFRSSSLSVESLEPRQLLAPVVANLGWAATSDLTGHHATLTFVEAINPATLTAADIAITAPDQSSVSVQSVNAIAGSGDKEFDVVVDGSASPAVYTMTVGADVEDPLGSLMDQDGDGTGGELTEDQFTSNFQILEDLPGWAIAFAKAGNVGIGPDGNLYVSGRMEDTFDFDLGPDEYMLDAGSFVAKYTPDMDFIWAQRFDDRGYNAGPKFDAAGNVYVDPGGATKLDADGNVLWSHPVTKIDHAVTDDGDLIYVGEFSGTLDVDPDPTSAFYLTSTGTNTDAYAVKLDTNGEFVWARQFGGVYRDMIIQVGLDGAGNVYATGFMRGLNVDFGSGIVLDADSNGTDQFVLKLDADGTTQWVRQIASSGGEYWGGMDVDASGNVFVGGNSDPVDPADTSERTINLGPDAPILTGTTVSYLLHVDSNNNFQWVKQLDQDLTIDNIKIDNDGNALVWGALAARRSPSGATRTPSSQTVDLDPGPGTAMFTSLDDEDAYLMELAGDNGNYHWGYQISGPDSQHGWVATIFEIEVDAADTIYLRGRIKSNGLGEAFFPTGDTVIKDEDNGSFIMRLDWTPEVKFYDSFENGQWNGLWGEDSQNDWFTGTQRAVDGSYSAEVDGRASDATLTIANSIDMSAYGSAELTFSWLIENGFDGGEYLALDFKDDEGTWGEILRLDGNVDQENTWHAELVQLDPQYLHSSFEFRYRSTVSRSNEDANVDNVQLIGTSLVGPPNTPPMADAGGPYATNEGSSVMLDGSGSSDQDGSIVSYAWDLDNDGQYDDATGVNPIFTPTLDGALTVGLEVTDNSGGNDSATATVDVTNVAPTASAGGPYTGSEGNNIVLDGSASSDPADDIVMYEWDLDNDGQYDDASGVSVAFNSTDDGVFTVGLRVTDDGGATSADTASVTVNNVTPTANAGGPYSTSPGADVTVTAAASTDPGNDIVSYLWDLDNDGAYDDASGVTATFNSAAEGTHTVGVQVTDDDGASSTATASVTVGAVETVVFADSFEVATWNGLWEEDPQDDWFRSTQRATDGNYSAEVDGRATDAMLAIADPVDLSSFSEATLTFSWYIENGFDNGEYLTLDVYNGTWQEVMRLRGNIDDENTWHQETVDLSPFISSDLRIRFRALANRANEDANVDDVTITASGSAVAAAPLGMPSPSDPQDLISEVITKVYRSDNTGSPMPETVRDSVFRSLPLRKRIDALSIDCILANDEQGLAPLLDNVLDDLVKLI